MNLLYPEDERKGARQATLESPRSSAQLAANVGGKQVWTGHTGHENMRHPRMSEGRQSPPRMMSCSKLGRCPTPDGGMEESIVPPRPRVVAETRTGVQQAVVPMVRCQPVRDNNSCRNWRMTAVVSIGLSSRFLVLVAKTSNSASTLDISHGATVRTLTCSCLLYLLSPRFATVLNGVARTFFNFLYSQKPFSLHEAYFRYVNTSPVG